MSDTVLVQACAAEFVEPTTGVCSRPVWVVYEPSPWPALTASEGAQIGAAIVGAWAVGAGIRAIYKAIR